MSVNKSVPILTFWWFATLAVIRRNNAQDSQVDLTYKRAAHRLLAQRLYKFWLLIPQIEVSMFIIIAYKCIRRVERLFVSMYGVYRVRSGTKVLSQSSIIKQIKSITGGATV